jgi:CubicO group peptidase (beta-lactamase class C family)
MKTLHGNAIVRGGIILCLIVSNFLGIILKASAQDDNVALFDRIDAYVRQEMSRTPKSGLALGIVHQDQIVHVFNAGSADPTGRPVSSETSFDIGSVAKTFTALAIQQLVAAGQIKLDDPVQTYIPWFRIADPEASKLITVRQVIDQTSGIPHEAGNRAHLLDPQYTLEDLVRLASTESLNRPVGESFEYSNVNYLIAGMVVEAVSGVPYNEYIQEHIFKPMEMDHCYLSQEVAEQNGMATGYRNWFGFLVPSHDRIAPGTYSMGHALCSVEDMEHYLIAYLNDGVYKGINIVQPGSPVPSMLSSKLGAYYDLHWYLQPGSSYYTAEEWSGGSFSFNSDLQILPGQHWGVIILRNARPDMLIPTTNASSIAGGVASLLQGWQPRANQGIGYWQYYSLINLGLIVLTGWVIFQLVQLYFAIKRNKSEEHIKRASLLWLGIDLLLGGIVLIGIPMLFDLPWEDMLADYKDISPVLLIDSLLVLAIGVIQLTLVVSRVRNQGRQPHAKLNPAAQS